MRIILKMGRRYSDRVRGVKRAPVVEGVRAGVVFRPESDYTFDRGPYVPRAALGFALLEERELGEAVRRMRSLSTRRAARGLVMGKRGAAGGRVAV